MATKPTINDLEDVLPGLRGFLVLDTEQSLKILEARPEIWEIIRIWLLNQLSIEA